MTSLDLKENEISDSGAKALGRALEKNETLLSLDLSENWLTNDGVSRSSLSERAVQPVISVRSLFCLVVAFGRASCDDEPVFGCRASDVLGLHFMTNMPTGLRTHVVCPLRPLRCTCLPRPLGCRRRR